MKFSYMKSLCGIGTLHIWKFHMWNPFHIWSFYVWNRYVELEQFIYENFTCENFTCEIHFIYEVLCVKSLCGIGTIHIWKFHICEIFMCEINFIYWGFTYEIAWNKLHVWNLRIQVNFIYQRFPGNRNQLTCFQFSQPEKVIKS